MAKIKFILLAMSLSLVPLVSHAVLVDTNGNVATNETLLGDIDMGVGTVGDLKTAVAPDYTVVSNAAMNALSRAEAEAGFTEWTTTAPVPSGWYISHPAFWILFVGDDEYSQANTESEDATEVTFSDYTVDAGGGLFITPTFTRSRLPTMADIPTNNVQLVNGAGYVTAAITNGVATTSWVTEQGYVTAAVTNGLASTNEVVLTPMFSKTPTFSEWVIDATGTPYAGTDLRIEWDGVGWMLYSDNSFVDPPAPETDENATSLDFYVQGVTATRTRTDIIGYTLGSQEDKALASTNVLSTIAPDYANISNKAVNAVRDSISAATNSVPLIDLISSYGIASGVSNAVEQMTFLGCLTTNRFVMAYDSSAASPGSWTWTIYSGKSTDSIATGTVENFSPITNKSFTITLTGTAAQIYGTESIKFETGKSCQTTSGLVRAKDLSTIVYDNETDWMSLYFKGQTARYYPNSNQVVKIVGDSISIATNKVVSKSGDTMTGDLAFSTTSKGIVYDDIKFNRSGIYSSINFNAYGIAWPDISSLTSNDTIALVSQIPQSIRYVSQLENDAGYVTAAVTNGLASTNEVVLTPVYGGNGKQFSEWVFSDVRPATGGYSPSLEWGVYNDSQQWLTQLPGMSNKIGIGGTRDQLQISYSQELEGIIFAFTATRTHTDIIGYTLGTQTDKVLAATNGIPVKVSQLANDAGFVTKAVTNGLASIASLPTKTSDLTNDSGFATTGQVVAATNALAFSIEINTNFVRRTDNNFSLGSGNSLGSLSTAIGNNNTVGIYSHSFGYNNTLSSNSSLQYAFGVGNRSSASGNFIMGAGSGAESTGSISLSLGTMAVSTNAGAFVWNYYPTDYFSVEADQIFDLFPKYFSHGDGSFNINPTGGLRGFWIGETNLADHIAASVESPISAATNAVTSDMKQFVTNSVVVGYTPWTYTGNTSSSAVYSILMGGTSGAYTFTLQDTVSVTDLGTVTTNILNPTVLVYSTSGITASRQEIRRNQNGFAYYTDVHQLRTEVENMDTSYHRFDRSNTLTNVNQSVQYIETDSSTTVLNIEIPTTGVTKDWIVYVNPAADLTINLQAANYWISSDSVTNDIPAGQPTALYFSQITTDTYSIGRKEFTPVTISLASRMTKKGVKKTSSAKAKIKAASLPRKTTK